MSNRGERIPIEWLRGIAPSNTEAKDERITLVAQSSTVLQVLWKLLEARIEEVERKMSHDFSNPAWPYHQAQLIGMREAYKEIQKLLPTDKFLEAKVKDL